MKKILIPIDGTERSKKSLDFVSKVFPKDSVEITLMNVKEIPSNLIGLDEDMKTYEKESINMMNLYKKTIEEYSVNFYFSHGYPGDEIIQKANYGKYNAIIMTKSTKKNFFDSIGSITIYVVKYAKCAVIIVPE